MSTITEAHYSPLSLPDYGFMPLSAQELRTKMSSRQSAYAAIGLKAENFTETDGLSRCREINIGAIDWARAVAPPRVVERWERKGRGLVVGEDIGPLNCGPSWINTPLQYEISSSSNGSLVVRSPTLMTPLDYPVGLIAGYHYCKLLSPARVMEWFYTDSLRKNETVMVEMVVVGEGGRGVMVEEKEEGEEESSSVVRRSLRRRGGDDA